MGSLRPSSFVRLIGRTGRRGRCRRSLPPAERLEDRRCLSVFYDFDVVARTGVGGLTALGDAPSINDSGTVAFAGTSAAGDGVYVRTLTDGDAREITGMVGSLGTLLPAVQINDNNLVVEVASNAPQADGITSVRTWDATATGSGAVIATARTAAGATYNRFQSGIAIGNDDGVVFVSTKATKVSVNIARSGVVTPAIANGQPQQIFPAAGPRGMFVARTGAAGGTAIVLCERQANGAFRRTVVASEATGFTRLGGRPGISDDGSIVVFSGVRSGVAGVFASIAVAGGTRVMVRVAGGDIAPGTPELGYADDAKPLFLGSFDFDAAVGVARQSLQPAGVSRDSFVVTFIATPNAASRPNPTSGVLRPLLFTSQKGVWSVRVDEEQQLSGGRNTVFHRVSPMPVVQIGDRVGGKVVASLRLGDAVADAKTTVDAAPRTQRRGDHQLVFWMKASDGTQQLVRGRHLDSDTDGLLDHWESGTGGIDVDQDGGVDLKLSDWGADVSKRDLFFQIDWLPDRTGGAFDPQWSNQLAPGVTAQLVAMFRDAPAVGTGAGHIAAGITLHVDAGSGLDRTGNAFSQNTGSGSLQGGPLALGGSPRPDVVSMTKDGRLRVDGVVVQSLDSIKNAYFSQTDRFARELAFHFSVLADFHGFVPVTMAGLSARIAAATATTLTSAVAVSRQVDVGAAIIVSAGAGRGQVRHVTAISADRRHLTLDAAWTMTPNDAADPSRFAVLSSSTGIAEVDWRAAPDFGPFPGNDFLVSLGGLATDEDGGGVQGTFAQQWRTIAHEVGHNFGLRHHGRDHVPDNDPAYASLMSYAYQLQDPSSVNTYAGANDPLFDDWANLRLDFQTSFKHLGNAFDINAAGRSRGGAVPARLRC